MGVRCYFTPSIISLPLVSPIRPAWVDGTKSCKGLDEGQLLVVLACARLELEVRLVGLLDDVQGELLVEALVVIAESVLRLAVRHLVIPEPLKNLLKLTWELPASTPTVNICA